MDIGEPLDPVFAGCFAHRGTGRQLTGTTHDAQCVLYHGPDEAYQGREICLSANETALSVADVTDKRAAVRVLDIGDPENPVEAGYFDTTSPGADKSGFVGVWSIYPFFESGSVLVSSRSGGLFVVRPRSTE